MFIFIIFCKCLMGSYGSVKGSCNLGEGGAEGGVLNRAAHRFCEAGVMS